ncbi:MAG: hypothetical protein KGI38_11900 [Thaumarchaeota archaeon]|nr:hypothetical protein [Nitrososphaerota archaeon]
MTKLEDARLDGFFGGLIFAVGGLVFIVGLYGLSGGLPTWPWWADAILVASGVGIAMVGRWVVAKLD